MELCDSCSFVDVNLFVCLYFKNKTNEKIYFTHVIERKAPGESCGITSVVPSKVGLGALAILPALGQRVKALDP
jgi:hypothetical protein